MTFAITGIKDGLGPGEKVPLRREIDEWWFSKEVNDLNQGSLFIYALDHFMKMPPKEQLSYFRVAGTYQPRWAPELFTLHLFLSDFTSRHPR